MKSSLKKYFNDTDNYITKNKILTSTISKSEIKRDDKKLKKITKEIIKLKKNTLNKILQDQELFKEIKLAQRLKKEGRRRQIQLIRKILRQKSNIYTKISSIIIQKNKNFLK